MFECDSVLCMHIDILNTPQSVKGQVIHHLIFGSMTKIVQVFSKVCRYELITETSSIFFKKFIKKSAIVTENLQTQQIILNIVPEERKSIIHKHIWEIVDTIVDCIYFLHICASKS